MIILGLDLTRPTSQIHNTEKKKKRYIVTGAQLFYVTAH
jgi:hypothetical protein